MRTIDNFSQAVRAGAAEYFPLGSSLTLVAVGDLAEIRFFDCAACSIRGLARRMNRQTARRRILAADLPATAKTVYLNLIDGTKEEP